MSSVPGIRVRALNDAPVRRDGDRVVYWMVANRRLDWNFALQRAVERARELDRPLVVLEALRVGYRWASDRLHRFALDGMRDHRRRLAGSRVLYHPYVEPEEGSGSGLLEALAEDACLVVTDDWPCFFVPRMQDAAARRLDVPVEAVDSNGLLPVRATDRVFRTARSFRRHLQEALPGHLVELPAEHPLQGAPLAEADGLPGPVERRWPPASDALLEGTDGALADLPVDHRVPPVPFDGGPGAGADRLARFLDEGLDRYAEARNDPDAEAGSRLSPYLHWGHVSTHQVFDAVARREGWSPARLGGHAGGAREGWWGMGEDAEAFLDELVTWREIGFNRCALTDDYADWESLPEWARETLERHADDARPHLYDREELEEARTDDEIWNAAQRELRREGTIHNYLRMLWGKRILTWTPDPRTALEVMVELNDRWAVDGRDPNSYNGIFWVLGRYDRGWPERDVFGKVRSMTSGATRQKLELDRYLERYGPCAADP